MTPGSDPSRRPSRSSTRGAAELEQLSLWEGGSAPPHKRRKAPSRKKTSATASNPELSGIVGREILRGELNPAFWAIALAESDGSRDHAITCYARLRLASLEGETHSRKLKEEALDARRRAGFRESPIIYTASPLPAELARPTLMKKTIPSNRRRHRLSLFWLLTCALGLSGAASAATHHYQGAFPEFIGGILLSVCLSIGPLLAICFTTLHFCAPRTRPIVRHLIPATACAAACASLLYGLLVIKTRIEGIQSTRSASRPPTRVFPTAADSNALNSIAGTGEQKHAP
jgi:hypothetical protein